MLDYAGQQLLVGISANFCFIKPESSYAILTVMKRRLTAGVAAAAGYTIVEVMIVLAITALMFVSIALSFQGKTQKTEFEQSVRDLESRILQVTSDVSNGYYSNTAFTCTGNPGGGVVSVVVGSAKQGANDNCIFLGKTMAFTDGKVNIFSVVGRQFTLGINSSSVENLAEALPIGVAAGNEDYAYKFGLNIASVIDPSSGNNYAALAVISQLGGAVGSSNPLSGSRTLQLYGVRGSVVGDDLTAAAARVSAANLVPLDSGARLCLVGGYNDNAQIAIGDSGNQVTTNLTLYTGNTNGC